MATASCGASTDATGADTAADRAGGGLTGRISVFAASSLTASFADIGRRFEAANPGVRVVFSFGASSALADQVRAGAPADVVATADQAALQDVVDDRLVGAPKVFARNRLAILVARGNPEHVRGLADLARPDLTLVLCANEVPCGSLAARALARAGVTAEPRSLEPNVKAVVSRLVLGEADAGVVYATDVRTAGEEVEGVDIAPEHNVSTAYVIATLSGSGNGRLADAFEAYVLSEQGRRTLLAAGFEAP